MRAVLIFLGSDGKPTLRARLPEGRSVLGTDPECDFVTCESEVAPRHVEFDNVGNRVKLVAIDRHLATRIDGAPVAEHWLVDGEVIELGANCRIGFEHKAGLDDSVLAAPKPEEPENAERAFQFLRTQALFYTMPDDSLQQIAERIRYRRVAEGETVVKQGEPGEAFYLIRSGRLKVKKDGVRVAELGPNDFFGEVALLTHGARAASVIAMIPCDLYEVDRECFDSIIKSNQAIAKHFVRVLASYGDNREEVQEILARMAPSQPRVGVALAAGAASGLVELGVLKVLEEEKIPIHMISGCSIGALIGATYALSGSYQETYELFANFTRSQRFFRQWMMDYSWLPWRGLIKGDRLLNNFRAIAAGKDDFSTLKIPFRAVAANLDTGREVVFKDGSVTLAIRASISIPAIFEPVIIEGQRYVDGGIVNPLPVNVLAQEGIDVIIAVRPHRPGLLDAAPGFWSRNFFSVLTSSLSISIDQMSTASGLIADTILAPEVHGIGTFDMHRLNELVEIGDKYARTRMEPIHNRLKLRR
jgi:NTE family protein